MTHTTDPLKRTTLVARRAHAGSKTQWEQSAARRRQFVEAIEAGMDLDQACAHVSVGRSAYKRWREKFRDFAALVDVARYGQGAATLTWDGTHISFAQLYLDWHYAPHQLEAIQAYEQTPPGHILITLWPPDHGKTATYENYATEKLSTEPETTRLTVTSESLTISKKILGKVKNRLEPGGPFPKLVSKFGPFKPIEGQSRQNKMAQPWSDQHFNVWKKRTSDERDYSMQALGFGSSIVSTRSTHLHIDDLQSSKTAQPARSRALEKYVRQDCLTRTGEHGINTWACTRVSEDDAVGQVIDDDELAPLVKVLKFKAIRTDHATGEQRPLWAERYSLDQLDNMRRKVGPDIWDLSYMHTPGTTDRTRTFTDEVIEPAKSKVHSLTTIPGPGTVVYVGLDPALGGINCVLAAEITPDGKLIPRWVKEQQRLRRNEEIMAELETVIKRMKMGGARVTDVVVEENNFQKGLRNDDRLKALERREGFVVRGHLSGVNKYDEDIGIPSLAGSMRAGEVIIPWADDPITQAEMGELVRQLRAWKPGQRGSKHRMDRLMALWFVWILWQERWKQPPASGPGQFKRQALPWSPTSSGLLVPSGRR